MWIAKYEGGSYDGCLWEVNFLLCDDPENPQEFVNIYASGFRGIRSLAALQKLVTEKPGEWYWGLYNLDAGEWETFRSEVSADQAQNVGKWLINYYEAVKCQTLQLTMMCHVCEEEISVTEILLEDWHGVGGVHSECTNGICQACKDLCEHQEFIKDIARLIENQWDELDAYPDWESLENDPSSTQDQIIEYAIRRWGEPYPDPSDIADWIMSNWDEAKKGMCQDDQGELSL